MVAEAVTKGTTTDDIGAGVEGTHKIKVCSPAGRPAPLPGHIWRSSQHIDQSDQFFFEAPHLLLGLWWAERAQE